MRFNVSLRKRLLMLLFAFIIGYFILSVISVFVQYKFGFTTPSLRIITVLQDLVLFILPAVGTAMLVTRQPATLMCLDRKPEPLPLLWAAIALVAAIPAMNEVIWLNENVSLPRGIYEQLKSLEDNAASMVEALNGPHNVPNLIVSILIVGIFAGISEEILFRGAFQRMMITGGVNHHLAIWLAAAVFSLLHMQFFGFVPRMLLGAFFGYALYWTKSLWVPIILHAFNNTLYLVFHYLADGEKSQIDEIGANNNYIAVVLSILSLAFCLMVVKRIALKACAGEKTEVEA